MALKLLYERKLGPESKLAPYVAALPADFSTPLSWTDAQLQALRYPHLLQEVLYTPFHDSRIGEWTNYTAGDRGPHLASSNRTCDTQARGMDANSHDMHFLTVRCPMACRSWIKEKHILCMQATTTCVLLTDSCSIGLQVAAQREGLKRLHAELAESTPGTPITEQDLIWALQAVRSRAFSGPYAGAHTHTLACQDLSYALYHL